jgi:ElaB/YqjD/DUF883 family membrane-anchored ribosome-binding protein
VPSNTKNPSTLEEVKHKAEETAKDVGQAIGKKADDATAAAGRGMQTVADKIRDNAPNTGVVGAAAEAVSDRIESGGQYLEKEKLSGMMEDVTDVIRKNPVPTLLVAVAVGFLLGRALSSRS